MCCRALRLRVAASKCSDHLSQPTFKNPKTSLWRAAVLPRAESCASLHTISNSTVGCTSSLDWRMRRLPTTTFNFQVPSKRSAVARSLLLLGLISLSTNGVSYAASNASAADLSRTMIDLSLHNPDSTKITSDWRESYGIELVFYRATIGLGDIDDTFQRRFPQIAQAGLYAGAYHLLWNKHTGQQQAAGFLNALKNSCRPGQPILLAVDWEPIVVNKVRHGDVKDVVDEKTLEDFIQSVNAETHKPVLVYTDVDMLTRHRREISSIVFNSPLWLSTDNSTFWERSDLSTSNGKVQTTVKKNGKDLRVKIAVRGRALYVIPTESDVVPWKDWTFWQFGESFAHDGSARRTSTPGKRPVDLSYFNGGRNEFRDFFNKNAWICPGPQG
jgi:GH25 family lysozyme M1 (1,4-beta-N-acetylmuramidase)